LWAEDVIDSYHPCGLHLFSLRRRVCAQAVVTRQKWLVGVVVWCVGGERSGRRRTTTSEAPRKKETRASSTDKGTNTRPSGSQTGTHSLQDKKREERKKREIRTRAEEQEEGQEEWWVYWDSACGSRHNTHSLFLLWEQAERPCCWVVLIFLLPILCSQIGSSEMSNGWWRRGGGGGGGWGSQDAERWKRRRRKAVAALQA
jgi:hypothetical protein